jgi:hypothetical protein
VPPSTFQISNGAGGGSGREADLARREAELARREAELQQLAADAKPRVSALAITTGTAVSVRE